MPGTKRKGKGDAWYFEVTIGTDFSGKPVRYNRTFHGTEKQAEKALARFYADCEEGRINKGSTMTIKSLSLLYLDMYVKKHLKKSNPKAVGPAIHKHIIPDLGARKVTKLTRLDIQNWIDAMAEKKMGSKTLSPKTVKNYYSVLSGMMKFAVRMEIIERSPCHDILLPKEIKKEARYYSKEEVAAFLEALESISGDEIKYKAVLYIALFGGLRNGEIMGLNWEDLDEASRTISIKRTRLVRKGGGVYEDTPKTERSERVISLPQSVISLLMELKVQQMEAKLFWGSEWRDSPAMFKNKLGDPMYPKAPARWLSTFVKNNGLPYISMHGLRHTHTSMLAYLDTDKLDISRRLGHSQLSTTLNIYTHLFEDSDRQIANRLEDFTENLRNAKNNNG